jgi:acyl-CoA reductase-like NAD-dependent aldehyde dehydrogenase
MDGFGYGRCHRGFNDAVSGALKRMEDKFKDSVAMNPSKRSEILSEYQQKVRDMQSEIRDLVYQRNPVWIRGDREGVYNIWNKLLGGFE